MKKEWNILVSESKDFDPEAKQILGHLGQVQWEDLTSEELPKHVEKTEVLWVRLRSRIDTEVLSLAPQLKVIASPTTGLTHIDVAAAAERNIQVLSLRGESEFLRGIRATAEFTIGLMLSLLRQIPEAADHVRENGWNRDLFRGSELYGRTVGIVGYGRLGRIVARYLSAFESNILITDPHVCADAELPAGARLVEFKELLEKADLVTIHVDLNSQTWDLFGREEFRRMKSGALLINTSRGGVIDEPALIEALTSGQLAGAALDVIRQEHCPMESPLIELAHTHPNLLITPHIGGCTGESMARTEVFLAERLRSIMATLEREN